MAAGGGGGSGNYGAGGNGGAAGNPGGGNGSCNGCTGVGGAAGSGAFTGTGGGASTFKMNSGGSGGGGGGLYGSAALSQLFLGSGGGGGGASNEGPVSGATGGSGGGILLILSSSVINSGTIASNGGAGSNGGAWSAPYGGGGAGSGGSVLVRSLAFSNSATFTAVGGGPGSAGGNSGNNMGGAGGGGGGVGRVRIEADAITQGTVNPAPATAGAPSAAGSDWVFFDNPSPADGATLAATLLPGSDAAGSYAESDPTPNNPNLIADGQEGEWDFALDPVNTVSGRYYLRMTRASATPLTGYTNLAIIDARVPPSAVDDLSAAPVEGSSTTLLLSWSAPGDDGDTGALLAGSSYYIQHSTDAAVVFSTTAAQVVLSTAGVYPGVLQQHALTGLSGNTTYHLRVWTADPAGNLSALSNGATTVTMSPAVSAARVDSVLLSSVTANWSPLPDASVSGSSNSAQGYVLEASTAADFSGVVGSSRTLGVSLSTLTIAGLAGDATYYFRVGSLNFASTAHYSLAGSTYVAPYAVADAIIAGQSTGTWYSSSSFTFSSSFAGAAYYRVVFDANAGHSWTGTEARWDPPGALTVQAADGQGWYLHALPHDAGGAPGVSRDIGPFWRDGTPPAASAFRSYDSTAGVLGETQVNDLTAGVTVQVTVSDLLAGMRSSPVARVFGFESAGLPTGWTTGGDANWSAQTAIVYAGTSSIRSGGIGADQSTYLETLLTTLGGYTTFYRRVSSQSGGDYLEFYINGSLQGSWSGENPWTVSVYAVPAGTAAFRWQYIKNGWESSGSDAAWLDAVSLPPVVAFSARYTRDAGATWTDLRSTSSLTGPYLSLTGSDGSLAGETLKILGLQLNFSTNAATCAAASPCGATNQVYFTAEDAAGNSRESGPYAVLVATTPSARDVSSPFSTGTWSSAAAVPFESTFSSAAYYRYFWDTAASHSWTETETIWSAPDGPLSLAATIDSQDWHLHVLPYNVLGSSGAPRAFGPYWTDAAAPAGSGFDHISSTGGALGESQLTTLMAGATVRLTVTQDSFSGLLLSTTAVPGYAAYAPGGAGSLFTNDGGASWVAFSSAASYSGSFDEFRALAVYQGKLYAGQGSGGGGGDVYACAPATGGSSTACEAGDWTLSANNAHSAVNALAVFRGRLYAGLGSNAGNDDIQVYDGAAWASSYDSNLGIVNAIHALAEYKGKLYATRGGAAAGNGDVLVCDPALTGAADVCDPGDWSFAYDGARLEFRSLSVFNGLLYAGQGSAAGDGDIYVCRPGATGGQETCENGDWSLSRDGASGSVYALEAFGGRLYAGLGYAAGQGDIYACDPALTGAAHVCDAADWSRDYDGATASVLSLKAYKGFLFAGTGSAAGDGDLKVKIGPAWKPVLDGAQETVSALMPFEGDLYAGQGLYNPDGRVVRLTPWVSSTALTGADGTTAAQSVSALIPALAASPDTTVCGGVSTCTARNQIVFAVSDLAGGVAQIGPFAVIASSTAYADEVAGPATGTWLTTSTMSFTSAFARTAYYRYAWDTSASHAWTEAEARWDPAAGITVQAAPGGQGWHLHVLPYSLTDGSGTPRDLGPFWSDGAPPAASAFRLYSSSGGLMGESQAIDLIGGATVQISLQDLGSGLLLSTGSLPGAAPASGGPGVVFSTDAGRTWSAMSAPVLARSDGNSWVTLAEYSDRLYAGMGPGAGAGDTYSCNPAATGDAAVCEAADWSLSRSVSYDIVNAAAVFNGKLYLGYGNDAGEGDIEVFDGAAWSNSYNGSQSNIYALAVFRGRLYAAQAGSAGTGDVLVCSPAATGDAQTCDAGDWSVALDGAGSNAYSLVALNGVLYAQTDDASGILRLLACTPGATGEADICDAGDWSVGYASQGSYNNGLIAHDGKLFRSEYNTGRILVCDPSRSGRAEICESGDWATEYDGADSNNYYFGRSGGDLFAGPLNGNYIVKRSSGVWRQAGSVPGNVRSLQSFNGRLYAGDSGADVYLFSPLVSSITVTGADGSTALETLTAVLPTLVNSTNSQTCGGGYPCGATNQVAFTIMDAAGNALWAGPYAVIVATTADAAAVVGPSTRAWVSFATFTFNSSFVNAAYYRRAWEASPSHAWTEAETRWDSVDGPLHLEASAPGTEYYLHVLPYNVLDSSGAPRVLGPYRRDDAAPAFSGFRVVSSTGGLMAESQLVDLAAGVTVQIQVQDLLSGLHVATAAATGELAAPAGGYGVIYTNDAGATWTAFASSVSAQTIFYGFESLAVFRGRLYAGQGTNAGEGDILVCDPAVTGEPGDCESGDWSSSRPTAYYSAHAMQVFNDRLYAAYGGWGGSGYGDIEVFDGASWTMSHDGPDDRVVALAAYGGKLYAGRTNGWNIGGGDVIVCDPAFTGAAAVCDSGDWSMSYDGTGYQANALVEFSGRLYAGFGSPNDGTGDIRVFDGKTWTMSHDGAFDRVNAFAVYGGRLYAAAAGAAGGEGDIMVCDPRATGLPASCEAGDWSVSHDGTTAEVKSLSVFNGFLFAGLGAAAGDGDLLVFDGAAWRRVYNGTSDALTSLAAFNGRLYAGSRAAGQARVLRLTPAVSSVTYTAAQGSTGAETLSAVIPTFADSLNSAVCGGTAPCTATNQVYFAAGDLAANAVHGPYAVLIDTSVTASADDVVSVRSTGTWYATSSFTFTSSFAGAGYYRFVFDANAGHAFDDSEPVWGSGTLSTGPASPGGAFYLHLKPFTLADVAGATRDLGPFRFDPSTPVLSGFAALDLGGAPLAEGAPLRLASGVTVQILVQDGLSGLSVRPSLASDRFETGLPERWVSTGPTAWYATADSANSGAFSLRAGTITHGQSTGVELVRRVRAGTLTFQRRVSSEADFDALRFFIDGQLQGSWSGTVAWGQVSFAVTAGTRSFRWSYEKDGTLSQGLDSAWIDDVVFPGSAYVVSYSSDAGATWRVASATVTTALPYVALTGAEGSTAQETLTAYGLDFAHAPSPVTCAGTAPCAATNQVIFSAADRTENESSGPYAVSVDTETYPGCEITRNVGAGMPYATISAGVAALPSTLTGHSCVVIRDGANYAEQVTVRGFTNNGSSITIFADPATGLRPVVDPPAFATAAFVVANASVSLQGIDVRPTAQSVSYGVLVSSAYVSLSSVNVQDAGGMITEAGIVLGADSQYGAVSYASATVTEAYGILILGRHNVVSFSSMTNSSNSDNTGKRALAILGSGASSNTVNRAYLVGQLGDAAMFGPQAAFNTLSNSTAVSFGSSMAGLYINDSDSNTVSGNYFENMIGYGVYLGAGAQYNTISQSTMISAAASFKALMLNGASSNTVTGSFIRNTAGHGASLQSGASLNVISQSTVSADAGAYAAVYVAGSDSNTLTGNMIDGGPGNALYLDTGSDYNTVSLSTLATSGVNRAGLVLQAATNNLILRVHAQSLGGSGGYVANANFNSIRLSTFVSVTAGYFGLLLDNANDNGVSDASIRSSNGTALQIYGARNVISRATMTAGDHGLYLVAAATTAVYDSYIQGSTAAYVSGSTGTMIGGSMLAATDAAGSALALDGGSVNLTIATSTLLAPSQGRGLALNPGSVGVVSIGSVTFGGAGRGVEISTQGANFTLSVDSVTFRGLASGATAIHFLGGAFVSTITLAYFEDASAARNVSAAALDVASRLTMRSSRGPRQGPAFEMDPNALVDWPDLLPPGAPSIFTVGLSSIGVQYGLAGADAYVVEASTMADFSGVVLASATLAQAARLAPQTLDPNTTYFLRAGSVWGGSTIYAQAVLSTATLSALVQGTTVYRIDVTSMIVNWLPLPLAPPDASSMSSSGYILEVSTRSDFVPLWTSSATPNAALSTLTASGLLGGDTYYFRVGSLNWNGIPNYAAAVSTLMPVQLGVELTTHTLSLPGLTAMNTTISISTSIVVTNTGNVLETYALSATTITPSSPWKIGASPAVDVFTLWTVVNSTQAGSIDFTAGHKLSDAETSCGESVFTMGNQSCVQVPIGQSRTLWFQISTPLATSTGAAQDVRITARAVKDP
ncbi:MAG: right-handed parallel beta-helix repeat-containing protein [Elusimicrobia bacterium]|nr:right-handed parallel beta-helix repeat-containing protein [Elusimicrobiota bacterium]